MREPSPIAADEISAWARRNHRTENEGWRRIAHLLTARCVARDQQLRPRVILGGGVALWLAHGNARTPGDFDLAVRQPLVGFDAEGIRRRVNEAIRVGMPKMLPDYAKWKEKL